MKLAGGFKRLIAFVIDAVILVALNWVILNVLLNFLPLDLPTALLTLLITRVLIWLVYFSIFEQSQYKATPGKMLMNLYVATKTNKKVSLIQAMYRFILVNIPMLPIIYTMLAIRAASNEVITVIGNELIEQYEVNITYDYWFYFLFSLILCIIWYAPMFFKSGKGMHDRVTGTRVLSK